MSDQRTNADLSAAAQALAAGLEALGIRIDRDAERKLIAYLDLLARWNRAYNLTAVDDVQAMVAAHLLDSLAVSPWLEGSRIVDVGSGAGLPGIPLAVANPRLAFTLIDATAKKVRFLEHVRATLRLGNVQTLKIRAQDYRPPAGFDTVVSRAFAPLSRLLATAGHLCGPGGLVLAMKGRWPDDEIRAIPGPWTLAAGHRLCVPGVVAQRHLLALRRTASG